MRRFDYSFLKYQIPGQIVSISNVISDLNARESLRKMQNPKAFDALRKRAIIESVKGSNAIEGIVTTDDRIFDLVKGAVPVTHDEKEISGYKDALSLIHSDHRTLDFTEDFLLRMHKMITGAVSASERVRAVVLNSLVPISKQEIAEKVPDISIKTVELVLGQLQKKGEIRKIGTFRDARYMRK